MTRSRVDDCIFSRIVAGTAPASVVHRDERCLAFMDIRPVHPGHLLVVPGADFALGYEPTQVEAIVALRKLKSFY